MFLVLNVLLAVLSIREAKIMEWKSGKQMHRDGM